VNRFVVLLRFHGELTFFLKRNRGETVERALNEKTSIKDVIESCGVPHTEVDLILLEGEPIDFAHPIDHDATVDVHSVEQTPGLFPQKQLQQRNLAKFVADGHLGKLARDLRLLGFDVIYERDAEDRQLLDCVRNGDRALLTRDRRLLMHSIIAHGYYLRSQLPLEQTIEVIQRFDLFHSIQPFSRCLRCNALLQNVEKNTVIDQLEPLTKIYYHDFRRCTACDQVYWAGSHFEKLRQRIDEIRRRSVK
jgi:uncharacterized protein with PIN domain